jgi:integrase
MLTDKECKNAAHKPKAYKLADAGSLYLFVTPTAKLWRMAYRFGGKEKVLSFGAYGDPRNGGVSIAAARAERDKAKSLISQGIDPNQKKVEAKREQAAALTFRQWAEAWLGKERQLWDERTMAGKERYARYLKAEFGTMLIPAIRRPDVLLYLKKLERVGTLETRDRVRSTGEQICTYADVDGSDHNPFRNLSKQLIENVSEPRPALTASGEVAKLFQTIAAEYPDARFGDAVGHAVRFIALTVVRPGEVANAEWAEVDFTNARWTIPAEKMKMKHEHVVPLSRQAVALLRQVQALTGHRRYVFSCSQDKPISDNTLNKRLRDLGYDTSEQHCAHGFRTTFSTLSNGECDRDGNKMWDGDLIELQLAHLDETSVKAIYNRTGPLSLIGARAKLLQHWADRIGTMVDGGNVVAINRPVRKRRKVA